MFYQILTQTTIQVGSLSKEDLWKELSKQQFQVHNTAEKLIKDPRFVTAETEGVIEVECLSCDSDIPRSEDNHTVEVMNLRLHEEAWEAASARGLRPLTPEEAILFFMQIVAAGKFKSLFVNPSLFVVAAQSYDEMPMIFDLQLRFGAKSNGIDGRWLAVRRYQWPNGGYPGYYVFAK